MDEAVSTPADSEAVVLQEIGLRELEGSLFAPGEVYWVKTGGQRVRVAGSGDVVDPLYLQKFEGRGQGLQVARIANISSVSYAKTLFIGLEQAVMEEERIAKRAELLRWFRNIYWTGSHRGSLLDLVKIGTEVFFKFDRDVTNRLTEASELLFKRAAVLAPISVFVCLCMGYLDFKFLRDMYHLCFLFDFAFAKENLSYNLMQATELERRKAGDGVACLFLGENPGPELEAFQFHPRKGMLESKELCEKYFNDPNLMNLIIKHHERVSGKGFPFGINEDEMSDLDTIIIFLNHLIPYEDFIHKKNDGQSYLKTQLERESAEDAGEVFGLRLKDLIFYIFENLPEEEEREFQEEDEL